MNSKNAKSIFLNVVENVPEREWSRHLDEVCADDRSLRQDVESLLAAHTEGLDLADQAWRLCEDSLTTLEPGSTERPGVVIGPYKLLQEIGHGGMGVVYMAEQTEPVERRVALKIIKPGMDTRQVIARFEAERQALALMDHPNIAKVLDAGTTDSGRPYFVMELVKGLPITRYCDANQLTTTQRLELFVRVCQAVQHAHQKGIIHRDIKPSNVLVALYDDHPVPKVIDFGVAKATNQRLTEKTLFTEYGQVVGTIEYMSPEQAQLNQIDVDTRSDVYSLGVLLYELLVGEPPFERKRLRSAALDEVLRIIREEEPPRPSLRLSSSQTLASIAANRQVDPMRLGALVRGDLDWIVMKALEKSRARRYETANALVRDVQRHLAQEPVEACPPSAAYRARKFIRRHRGGLMTAALISVALLIAAGVSLWQAQEANKARRLAEQRANDAQQAQMAEAAAREIAETERAEAEVQRAEVVRQRNSVYRHLYHADMRLASTDWESRNLSRLHRTLEDHLPRPDREDLRGWEWYYLTSLAHQEVQTLYDHDGTVSGVAWSPDGKHVASTSYDGTARIWKEQEGKLRLVRTFYESSVLQIGISWSPDGKRLAWGSVASENALRIWDIETDEISIFLGHTRSLISVCWSPCGRFVATSSFDATIRVWDADSNECLYVLTPNAGGAFDLAWNPDGALLATVDYSDKLNTWDMQTGEPFRELAVPSPKSVDWSPDGNRIAVGQEDGRILLVDVDDWVVENTVDAHVGYPVKRVSWSPNGSQLASCGGDGAVKVWTAGADDSFGCEVVFHGHRNRVASLDWSPDGERLVSAGGDYLVKIWELTTTTQPRRLAETTGAVRRIEWLTDSREIVSFDTVGSTNHWEISTGTRVESEFDTRSGLMAWSPDGKILAVRSSANTPWRLSLLKASSGEILQTLHVNLNDLSGVAWSPDGMRLAVWDSAGYKENGLEVWNASGERLWSQIGFWRLNAVCWSPDSRQLAVVGAGEESDGGYLRSAGWVYLFGGSTGNRAMKVRHGNGRVYARSVAWSPSGAILASGSDNGLLILWNAKTGQELTRIQTHHGRITNLDWSPEGQRLASAGSDGMVKVLDCPTGEELLTLSVDNGPVQDLAWSPSGRELAAVGSDGVVRIWDASGGYKYVESEDFQKLLASLHKERALALSGSGRWSEAIGELEQCLKIRSNDYVAWYRIGLLQQRLGQSDSALFSLSQVVQLVPKYDYAWACRGDVHAELENWEEALQDYRRAAECYDYYGRHHHSLALLRLKKGDHAGYRETCRRMSDRFASSSAPEDRERCMQFIWTRSLTPGALDGHDVALACARTIVDRTPIDQREAEAIVGVALYRAGRFDHAAEWLNEFAQDSTSNNTYSSACLFLFLSMAHHQLGHPTEAREWLTRAVDHIEEELREVAAVPWNRRLTFELLRKEAKSLLESAEAESREASSAETAVALDQGTIEWLQSALGRRRAHRLAAAGKMKEATDAILQVSKLQPDDSQLLRQLEEEQLAAERLTEAAALLSRAVTLASEEKGCWLELADLCTRIGDFKHLREATEMAVSALEVTGEEPPGRPGGLLNSGMALARRGHINEGCSLLKASAAGFGRLSRAHPENINYARSQAYSLLVWSDHCAEQTHRKEILAEAEEILVELLEHIEESPLANSEVAKLYCSCGQLYTRQGLIEKGRSMLTKAVENDPRSAWFRSRLAMALLDADGSVEARPAEAVEHAVTAMELKSESSVIIDTCREATAALRAALEEENSQDLGSRYLVAIGLALLGQDAEASAYLEQAEQRFGQMQADPGADLTELRKKALTLVNFDAERPADNQNE